MIHTRSGCKVEAVGVLDEENGEATCVLVDPESGLKFTRVKRLSELVADGGIDEIRKTAKSVVGAPAKTPAS